MSNIEELKQEQEKIMKMVQGFNVKLEEYNKNLTKKENKIWKFKEFDRYYYLDCTGNIESTCYRNDDFDIEIYKLNNMYKTKLEAEFAFEKQIILTELQRYANEYNEGVLDWNDTTQSKHYIYNNYCSSIEINIGTVYNVRYLGEIYFTSDKIALNAIKQIGEDRIKKYLFNVEV